MRFCKPMKRHFMTKAASNAAVALSMAKEVWCKEGWPKGKSHEDVQDLVHLIDTAALKLIAACERHASSAPEHESNAGDKQ
jgi:hypothetical protein